MPSSGSFSLPRRTSVRRRSTTGSARLHRQIPPSLDCSRYRRQSVPTRLHSEPSVHTTHAAKMADPFDQGSGWPLAPWSPSAIAGLDWVVAAAGAIREHDWPLRRKRATHRASFRSRGIAPLLPGSPPPDAAKTYAPPEWCPDSGPSIRRLCPRRACPAADIALAASFQVDARSQTAMRRLDRCGVTAFATHSCNRSAAADSILSRGASFSVLLPASAGRRRTEVRRGKAQLALRACPNRQRFRQRQRHWHD